MIILISNHRMVCWGTNKSIKSFNNQSSLVVIWYNSYSSPEARAARKRWRFGGPLGRLESQSLTEAELPDAGPQERRGSEGRREGKRDVGKDRK